MRKPLLIANERNKTELSSAIAAFFKELGKRNFEESSHTISLLNRMLQLHTSFAQKIMIINDDLYENEAKLVWEIFDISEKSLISEGEKISNIDNEIILQLRKLWEANPKLKSYKEQMDICRVESKHPWDNRNQPEYDAAEEKNNCNWQISVQNERKTKTSHS